MSSPRRQKDSDSRVPHGYSAGESPVRSQKSIKHAAESGAITDGDAFNRAKNSSSKNISPNPGRESLLH